MTTGRSCRKQNSNAHRSSEAAARPTTPTVTLTQHTEAPKGPPPASVAAAQVCRHSRPDSRRIRESRPRPPFPAVKPAIPSHIATIRRSPRFGRAPVGTVAWRCASAAAMRLASAHAEPLAARPTGYPGPTRAATSCAYRHVERTKALVYIVDVAAIDKHEPEDALQVLVNELATYVHGPSLRCLPGCAAAALACACAGMMQTCRIVRECGVVACAGTRHCTCRGWAVHRHRPTSTHSLTHSLTHAAHQLPPAKPRANP
jgi:hypothetical protein